MYYTELLTVILISIIHQDEIEQILVIGVYGFLVFEKKAKIFPFLIY